MYRTRKLKMDSQEDQLDKQFLKTQENIPKPPSIFEKPKSKVVELL